MSTILRVWIVCGINSTDARIVRQSKYFPIPTALYARMCFFEILYEICHLVKYHRTYLLFEYLCNFILILLAFCSKPCTVIVGYLIIS